MKDERLKAHRRDGGCTGSRFEDGVVERTSDVALPLACVAGGRTTRCEVTKRGRGYGSENEERPKRSPGRVPGGGGGALRKMEEERRKRGKIVKVVKNLLVLEMGPKDYRSLTWLWVSDVRYSTRTPKRRVRESELVFGRRWGRPNSTSRPSSRGSKDDEVNSNSNSNSNSIPRPSGEFEHDRNHPIPTTSRS